MKLNINVEALLGIIFVDCDIKVNHWNLNRQFYNYQGGVNYENEIIYQNDKLLSPRIDKTYNLESDDITRYGYDSLGRINHKDRMKFHMGIWTHITEDTIYKPNTLLKNNIKIKISESGNIKDYEFKYEYDNRGNIKNSALNDTITDEYYYDKANRLKIETKKGNYTIQYTYNKDGSINTEYAVGTRTKKYVYEKGRLSNWYYTNYPSYKHNFEYDNSGNCIKYDSDSINMEWERGNLLKKYTSSANTENNYYYNNQGIRFKKKVGTVTTTYYYDGAKLLREKSDEKDITYIYDAEGIIGFIHNKFIFHYVKDAMGNVIAIHNNDTVAARYQYDAWGNCTIIEDIACIGTLNLIRWKSQYYDVESGLYYINGRYYSPSIKQYISAISPETMMASVGTIYGLNMYLLTVENPVDMVYNGYTIATNSKLTWNTPSLSRLGKWLG